MWHSCMRWLRCVWGCVWMTYLSLGQSAQWSATFVAFGTLVKSHNQTEVKDKSNGRWHWGLSPMYVWTERTWIHVVFNMVQCTVHQFRLDLHYYYFHPSFFHKLKNTVYTFLQSFSVQHSNQYTAIIAILWKLIAVCLKDINKWCRYISEYSE